MMAEVVKALADPVVAHEKIKKMTQLQQKKRDKRKENLLDVIKENKYKASKW